MTAMGTALRRSVPREIGSKANGVTFALKLVLLMGLLMLGGYMALAPTPWLNVGGTVLLGLMFAHAVELQHQALHNLGFRRRRANEVVGILLGLPMLVSYAAYQASHLRHHAYLGAPRNKEFFDYGDQYGLSRAASIRLWATRFLMLAHYRQFFASVARTLTGKDFPDESARTSRRIRRDHVVMVTAIVLAVAGSAVSGVWLFVWLWILPFCLVAAPVHALVEMPEHYRCDTDSVDVLENTRTIKSNAFMTWFTNGNNFHVEHHLMSNLPIDRLPDLHDAIAPQIRHYHETYRDFFLSLIRNGR